MHWKSVRRPGGGGGGGTSSGSAMSSSSTAAGTTSSMADGSVLLALTRWSDEGHYLRDFLHKNQLPAVARVVKGQYLTLGVPTLSNPSQAQLVFLCSTGKRLKVAAQCVKFKEGSKKVVPLGPKLAIPENYDGWFEILSEEGRAVRCIESVAELARRFPDSCLVRDSIKAYVARGDDVETITDKVRTIAAGETLVLISEVLGTSANSKTDKLPQGVPPLRGGSCGMGAGGAVPGRFLRCFDAKGESVYLSFEQRGRFSIIAKEDNISGVHTIKNLLQSKRFPLMVRLVIGKTPVGGKVGSTFVPEMRLYASFEEECVMALPLQREPPSIVAVPTTAPIKLQGPKNGDLLQKSKEYGLLEEKCKLLIEEISDKIQVFDIMLSRELRNDGLSRKLPYFRRAFSEPYGYRTYGIDAPAPGKDPVTQDFPDKDDTRYDEIDQIYDYVRGFAPPPKMEAPPPPGPSDKPAPDTPCKPEPPPIETIPVRRNPDVIQIPPPCGIVVATSCQQRTSENVYERIPRKSSCDGGDVLLEDGVVIGLSKKPATNRLYVHSRAGKNTGSKIYVKSSSALHRAGPGPKSRFFRHHLHHNHHRNGAPPVTAKEVPKTVRSVKSSATSPIFNIRYKSLTNLAALDFDTLDSSNSGGKMSAGSGGSAYILEDEHRKKKRLPRPKSLTNLVWGNLNNQLDYNRANLLNSAICRLDPRRHSNESHSQSMSKESAAAIDKGSSGAPFRTKRIGTLYL